MKTFVLGDPHGGHKAMLQCFRRSGFNYNQDTLICLGDVVDGWPETKECIDELLKVKNLIYIIANHDLWALEWMINPYLPQPEIWLSQGGISTKKSYQTKYYHLTGEDEYIIPQSHIELLRDAHLYYEDKNNNLFVHGGINPNQRNMKKQSLETLTWDRDLLKSARIKHNKNPNYKYAGYDNIFIGHTTTLLYKSLEPLHYCNLWDLDTGCGWSGKLTIMNVDTKEYWQSDLVYTLYPECKGRG